MNTDPKWRNEFNPKERPSWDTVAICAVDVVGKSDDWFALVCHVKAFNGLGFMSSVRSMYGNMNNGCVFYGTDKAAHQKSTDEALLHMP